MIIKWKVVNSLFVRKTPKPILVQFSAVLHLKKICKTLLSYAINATFFFLIKIIIFFILFIFNLYKFYNYIFLLYDLIR